MVSEGGKGTVVLAPLTQRDLAVAGRFRDAPGALPADFILEALDFREKTGAAITAAITTTTAMSTNRLFLLAVLWIVFRVLISGVLLNGVEARGLVIGSSRLPP